jgi:hypothetical protein
MKIILFLAAGCVALTGGFALSLAQNPSPYAPVVTSAQWSRPDVNVPQGFQVRRRIDPNPASTNPTVVLRFEPIPASTLQALQQTAAANHTNLVWRESKIDGAAVFVDALQDGLPGAWHKAVRSHDDPRAFELVLPAPVGGWYNQPLRVTTSVWSRGEEVFASDTTMTLAP